MPPKKRKVPPTSTTSSSKTSKKNDTTTKKEEKGSKESQNGPTSLSATPKQLLTFLLSKESLPYCYPNDELDAANANSAKKTVSKKSPKKAAEGSYKSYSLTSPSKFTPFEHLLTAHLLSKPLSHTLGMRSIRTLFNAPFQLTSPETIAKEGERRVWEALESARTQHRQKTAAYIYQMAENYVDGETMYELAVAANEEGPKGVVEHIKASVKGMGVTGAEIFCRRIQSVDGWGEAVWPYADPRSLDSIRELGIPVEDAEELQAAIEREVDWEKVESMGGMGVVGLNEEEDLEVKIAAELVVVLERAVGCVLEGKAEEFKRAALGGK